MAGKKYVELKKANLKTDGRGLDMILWDYDNKLNIVSLTLNVLY